MSELVLIVDDEPGILSSLSGVLNDEGFRTVCSDNGERALELFRDEAPDVVFLDIWLPDRDGLEALQAMRELDPTAAVVMMSGHGTAATAAKAIKMGACDYVEKPLSYNQAVEAVRGAIEYRRSIEGDAQRLRALNLAEERLDTHFQLDPAPEIPLLREVETPQRTIARSTVFYGVGLHSGLPTGLVIQPLPPNSGIHFVTLARTHSFRLISTPSPTPSTRPRCRAAASRSRRSSTSSRRSTPPASRTCWSRCIARSRFSTARLSSSVGLSTRSGSSTRTLGARRSSSIASTRSRSATARACGSSPATAYGLLPAALSGAGRRAVLRVRAHQLRRVPREIAPARTFGFVKDLQMMSELGLGSGGRLDNCILVGEDDVINTDLRFDDEFVRHKILDIIGDLYLLGYPIRGRVTAQLTGHRDNIALLKAIQQLTT